MRFIEREKHNVLLKFGEIFPWRETVLRVHGMKSDEKLFFCQIYAFFLEKNGRCCDWLVFFFISEEFWRFNITRGYH